MPLIDKLMRPHDQIYIVGSVELLDSFLSEEISSSSGTGHPITSLILKSKISLWLTVWVWPHEIAHATVMRDFLFAVNYFNLVEGYSVWEKLHHSVSQDLATNLRGHKRPCRRWRQSGSWNRRPQCSVSKRSGIHISLVTHHKIHRSGLFDGTRGFLWEDIFYLGIAPILLGVLRLGLPLELREGELFRRYDILGRRSPPGKDIWSRGSLHRLWIAREGRKIGRGCLRRSEKWGNREEITVTGAESLRTLSSAARMSRAFAQRFLTSDSSISSHSLSFSICLSRSEFILSLKIYFCIYLFSD